jgi:methylated-DNA-[protein]-cysteine S-methyltransferase
MSTENLVTELTNTVSPDADHLRALHARLTTAAERDGVLDVAYRTVDTPVGTLLLAGTNQGIVRIAYESENHDTVLQSLADRISPRVLASADRMDLAARELDEYFAGRRRSFDLPLDWRLATGFRRTVLGALATDVGYGHTASYAAVAALAGNPKAFRAAATACATNPLPVIVPCHRVVRSDGSLGGYLGGVAAKQALLALEAA